MKVLVPVEDVEFGERLIKYIGENKWPQETVFKVFHVIDPSRLDHFSEVAFMELLDEAAAEERAEATNLVGTIAAKLRAATPDAEVLEEVTEGAPYPTILETARKWPADLIIIGSHGRNALQRFLLGSVSTAVIGRAPCSVLLVRRTDHAPTDQPRRKSEKMHVII